MKRSTNNASGSNSTLTLISVVIIAAFVIASALLVIPHIQQRLSDKAMSNGEQEANVAFLAKEQNMSVEDYLAQYGLEVSDTVNGDTLQGELADNFTVATYKTFAKENDPINFMPFSDAVSDDMLYKDLKVMPIKTVYGDETFASLQADEQLTDIINEETTYDDFWSAVQVQQPVDTTPVQTETTDETQTTPAE